MEEGAKETTLKLSERQCRTVAAYVEATGAGTGGVRLMNDHFEAMERLVLGLPACAECSGRDVVDILVTGFVGAPSREQQRGWMINHYVQFLESLPRSYTVRVGLPGFPDWGEFEITVCEGIRLVARKRAEQARNGDAESLEVERAFPTFLELSVVGYGSYSPESPAVSGALGLAKQVMFLSRIFQVTESYGFYSRRAKVILLDHAAGNETAVNVPETLAIHFAAFEPRKDSLVVVDGSRGGGLLGMLRAPENDLEWIAALQDALKKLAPVLEQRQKAVFGPLAAAIEWHQDSVSGDNQTVAFLAACIGLESLLGDPNQNMNEMTNRLSDRYAFMLGRDSAHRAELASQYREVLKKRGELVHARSSRLHGRDIRLLDRVQTMLEECIQHELRQFGSPG